MKINRQGTKISYTKFWSC